MKIFLYIDKQAINDATSHYMKIMTEALMESGVEMVAIYSWKSIKRNDFVVVITYKNFFDVYYLAKCSNIIFWFQGILPEEIKLSEKGVFACLKRFFYTKLEKVILKKSKLLFFVSEAMRNHFIKKHGYAQDNYVIMPCFNKSINKDSFLCQGKYLNPTFVYAGSLSSWQCIDETLELYKNIEDNIPRAKLVFFTSEKEEAKKLMLKKGVKNVEIDYIPVDELDGELKKYKYAFLIRDNIAVNNVATPTKMNTYLANGLIPIYSDIIHSFQENLGESEFQIPIKEKSNIYSVVKSIITMEDNEINVEALYDSHYKIFQTFYNEKNYKDVIRNKIQNVITNI